jgi:hypothetical protein
MKRLDPCVSFETAQKLKNAGYPQAGAFWYYQDIPVDGVPPLVPYYDLFYPEIAAAPTALEIMTTLEKYSPILQFTGTFFDCLVHTDGSDLSAWDLNPHEAAAKLWIELKEK